MGKSEKHSRVRLESWKEISSFLGVSTRTAQKWESERGLPIHRRGTGRGARVAAYTDELRSWRKRDETKPESSQPLRLPLGWFALIGGALVLALWSLYGPGGKVSPSEAIVEGSKLLVKEDSGEIRWHFDLPSPTIPLDLKELPEPIATFHDVDGDSSQELLFSYRPRDLQAQQAQLICFEEDGSVKWVTEVGEKLNIDGREFRNTFRASIKGIHTVADREYLVVYAEHVPFYPSRLLLIDPQNGEILDDYWHPGHLNRVHVSDFDQDGTIEILAAGTNNPGYGLGHAILVCLEIPFSEKPSDQAVLPNFFGEPNNHEDAYVVFPNIDVFEKRNIGSTVIELKILEDSIRLSVGQRGFGRVYYFLTHDLRLTDVRPSDHIWVTHLSMYREGILDHKLSGAEIGTWGDLLHLQTAPDGNSAQLEEEFETRVPADAG